MVVKNANEDVAVQLPLDRNTIPGVLIRVGSDGGSPVQEAGGFPDMEHV